MALTCVTNKNGWSFVGTDSITKMDVDDPEDVDAVHLALKKLLQDTFVNDFTSEDTQELHKKN